MTKKRTLLAAIFVNASLLILLFAVAITDPATCKREASLAKLTPDAITLLESKEDLLIKEDKVLEENPLKDLIHKLPPIEKQKEEEKPLFTEEKAPSQKGATISVQPGDNLEKIAKRHHCSARALQKANNLPTEFLKVGQVLTIPEKEEPKVEQKKKIENKEERGYYQVKSGDNPWTIAMKHHMRVEELLKLNELDEKKAKKLKPGDRLRIR